MSFEQVVRIPIERVGAVIGKEGGTKRFLEQEMGVRLSVDSKEGLVTVKSESALKTDPFSATRVIEAIGRGFSPQRARRLLDEGTALEVIDLARDSLNPDLQWVGVVLNIADMRTRHSREAFDSLREHFGEKLFQTTIRASIAYAESAERAVSILDYRRDLGADYLNVAEELLQRIGLEDARRRVAAMLGDSPAARASA